MAKQYSDSQFSATSIGDAPEAEIIVRDIEETENENIAKGLKERKFDEATIKKLIENFDSVHKGLHERQDDDMRLYELEDFELDIFSDSMTFNEPRHMGDMVIQLCTGSILMLTVETEEQDQDINNIIEQFHLSFLKSADEWLGRMLMAQLKQALSFYGAIRGWMVLRITIYRDANGKLVPCIMALDPRQMKWGVGMGGFVWVAHETWRTAEEILLDYGKKPDGEVGKITDFWSDKENVILLDDKEIKGKRYKHNIGYPPFIILPCSNQPKVMGNDMSEAKKHLRGWGESVYASNRKLYPVLNKILSIWLSLVVKAHKPGGFIVTDDDQVNVEELPYGSGTAMKLPIGSSWVPVVPADIARSTPELFGQIAAAVQRGGISWVTYGQLWKGQELSGNALEELKQGLGKIVTPILDALNRVFQRAARMVEEQFMSYGEAWEAVGYDTRGQHFFKTIEPDDISSNHEIRFEFLSITPQEEAANIAKAQMMKSINLADDEFIDKEIMKFQDPAGIEDRKLMMQGKALSPKIAMLEIIKAYRKRGEDMYADILSAELEKALMMEQMQQQQAMLPQGQPGAPQEAAPAPTPALPQGFSGPRTPVPSGQPRTLIAGPPSRGMLPTRR
jgi:hypothetical protein